MSAAEARLKMSGGSETARVLQQINSTLTGTRRITKELNQSFAEGRREVGELGRKVVEATNAGTAAIRDEIKAQAEATRAADEAARAAQAAANAARAAASTKAREEAKAAREAVKALKEQEKAAKELGATLISVGRHALATAGNINKMAGVKSFGEQKQSADTGEELMVRARTSIGKDMTKEKWKSIGAQNSMFKAAKASGIPFNDIVSGFIRSQNENSNGEELLANGGALLTEQARFAQATGSNFGDATTTLAKFAAQYKISPEKQKLIPGMLIAQQLQGSLEAATSGKFVKQAAMHQLVTGKGDAEGFAELMALGNVVKDKAGLSGMSGAATASTWTGSFLSDLSKGKSANGLDTSPTAMLKKVAGIDIKDKDGHVNLVSLGEKLAGFHDKVGDAKFSEAMGMAFRNVNSKRVAMFLAEGAKNDKGTGKSLEALSNPDSSSGQALIKDTLDDLAGTAKGKEGASDINEQEKTMNGIKGTNDFLADWRESVGGFMADHPALNAGWEAGKDMLGAATLFGLGAKRQAIGAGIKTAAGAIAGVGVGTMALAGGALMLQGDDPSGFNKMTPEQQQGAGIAELKAQIANYRKLASDQEGTGFGAFMSRHMPGGGDPDSNRAMADRLEKSLAEALSKMPPPQINITITGDTQARVIAETAHPTAAKAAGAGAPKAQPGVQ